jgi:hypothetical protein
VIENRELRRIFVPNREEMLRGWGNLRNEKLNRLYYLHIIIEINQAE